MCDEILDGDRALCEERQRLRITAGIRRVASEQHDLRIVHQRQGQGHGSLGRGGREEADRAAGAHEAERFGGERAAARGQDDGVGAAPIGLVAHEGGERGIVRRERADERAGRDPPPLVDGVDAGDARPGMAGEEAREEDSHRAEAVHDREIARREIHARERLQRARERLHERGGLEREPARHRSIVPATCAAEATRCSAKPPGSRRDDLNSRHIE